MSDVDPDATLDATGLKCPLPVLKAKKAMRSVAPGQILKILATDPDSPKDFRHFCATTGDELLSTVEHAGIFTFFIRKSPGQ